MFLVQINMFFQTNNTEMRSPQPTGKKNFTKLKAFPDMSFKFLQVQLNLNEGTVNCINF